ncbi:eCIS core domain-containing protein [Streptomyces similanensis]|uniref:eCIS core domain-containing protein n=1 Tax=Streptomyces similanensis TaxID=1274988 RepID=A0ABP9L100_9ACTN
MRSQDQSKDPSGRTAGAVRTPRVQAPVPPQHAVAARSPQALLALQRTAGNAAVVQLAAEQDGAAERDGGAAHSVGRVLRSAGAPLDGAVRRDMEQRLGADFGDVRLHTDAAARQSAAEVGARAYTSGSHVVIGDGGGDRHTLAHELTHVIQQRSGPVAGTDHGDGLRVSDPSDSYERAAEDNARRALAASPSPTAADPAAHEGHTHHHDGPAHHADNGPAPAVQRVRSGRPTGLTTAGGDDAYFTTQSPEGVLRDGRSPGGLIGHRVDHVDAQDHHPGDVSLRISDDGTLAVHDTEREPKEFYATNAVFQHAVQQLAQSGSHYTLVQGGAQIKTEAGTLTKVTPVTADPATRRMAGGFADLVRVQCIDVAREVVGSRRMDVVTAGGGTAAWGANAGPGLAHHLAGTVRSGDATDGAAAATAAGAGPDRPEREVARDYGTALREHPAEADAAARDMGVNRHARPEVGEGIATLSVGSDDKLDYATAPAGQDHTDRTDVDVWNYHFAGVVARSLDGADWVTLENYTRNQNAQRALSQLEGRLIGAYREKTKSLLNSFRGKEPPQGGLESARVIEMIQKLADTTRNRAMQEYQALGTDQLAWQGKWFFRLYGSQAGETFHDKQYASGAGDFVNPLTVRVRRQTDATGDA